MSHDGRAVGCHGFFAVGGVVFFAVGFGRFAVAAEVEEGEVVGGG